MAGQYDKAEGAKRARASYKNRKSLQPDFLKQRNALHRNWARNNPDKVRLHSRRKHLKKKYGISIKEYDILYEVQNGCCAVCGKWHENWDMSKSDNRAMSVDHDHCDGRVRGLLCIKCNTAIERFDSVKNFAVTVEQYLKKDR